VLACCEGRGGVHGKDGVGEGEACNEPRAGGFGVRRKGEEGREGTLERRVSFVGATLSTHLRM
jgi:hypothetical protein